MLEDRILILEQFCMIIEEGIFLGSKIIQDEIINIHKVNSMFAVVHYSTRNRIVNHIDWCKSLSKEQEEVLTFKPKDILA